MFDIIIRNGTCYAGDGRPGFRADIAIAGGKILKIGVMGGAEARREIDAENLSVAPGFIDTHSHSDLVALVEPDIANKTTQGITTDIIGQDGMSLAPVVPEYIDSWKKVMAGLEGNYEVEWNWRRSTEYLDRLDSQNLGPNIAYLVPYGNIRMCAAGLENRPVTENEIAVMCGLLEEGIANGAVGLSTGLIYPPCSYAPEQEITQVTTVLARYGLPFVIHQRSEADDILNSMDEVIRIGRNSGCHIHFSHFKVAGMKNAGMFDLVMKKLDDASKEISLSLDQYPYTAGSTTFSVILPPWVHSGGAEKALARLTDKDQRQKMKKDIIEGIPGWDNFVDFAGMENIFVTFVKTEKNQDLVGKNMLEIGEIRGKDPLDAAFDLLVEEDMSVGLVDFYGLEEHVEQILVHPLQNPCTDGILGAHPHPRVYGSFSRILGHYVRERRILDIPSAVHKMTARPASIFKLKNRGLLKEGYQADITLFDAEKVTDRATYENPKQFSDGIPYVIVGGKLAVDNGEPTRQKSGCVIRNTRIS